MARTYKVVAFFNAPEYLALQALSKAKECTMSSYMRDLFIREMDKWDFSALFAKQLEREISLVKPIKESDPAPAPGPVSLVLHKDKDPVTEKSIMEIINDMPSIDDRPPIAIEGSPQDPKKKYKSQYADILEGRSSAEVKQDAKDTSTITDETDI